MQGQRLVLSRSRSSVLPVSVMNLVRDRFPSNGQGSTAKAAGGTGETRHRALQALVPGVSLPVPTDRDE